MKHNRLGEFFNKLRHSTALKEVLKNLLNLVVFIKSNFPPFSDNDRLKIKDLLNKGYGYTEIAKIFGRTRSAICYEVHRRGGKENYQPLKKISRTPFWNKKIQVRRLFDGERFYFTVTNHMLAQWKKKFPHVDIDAELFRFANNEWCSNHQKDSYSTAITNWLAKADDEARDMIKHQKYQVSKDSTFNRNRHIAQTIFFGSSPFSRLNLDIHLFVDYIKFYSSGISLFFSDKDFRKKLSDELEKPFFGTEGRKFRYYIKNFTYL